MPDYANVLHPQQSWENCLQAPVVPSTGGGGEGGVGAEGPYDGLIGELTGATHNSLPSLRGWATGWSGAGRAGGHVPVSEWWSEGQYWGRGREEP